MDLINFIASAVFHAALFIGCLSRYAPLFTPRARVVIGNCSATVLVAAGTLLATRTVADGIELLIAAMSR